MSSLAWIDFDKAERQSAQRIMALFQERESRDELGLGSARWVDGLLGRTRHRRRRSCVMNECIFGWGKQHGTKRKTKHRGIGRVAANFLLNLIAYTHGVSLEHQHQLQLRSDLEARPKIPY